MNDDEIIQSVELEVRCKQDAEALRLERRHEIIIQLIRTDWGMAAIGFIAGGVLMGGFVFLVMWG